jgi:glutathione S-transferase
MIKVHHLNESRSQRILWLLEELAEPYELVTYQRDAATRLAPPELKAVHPLGKSPVLEDGDVKLIESGAIVEYLAANYGKGRLGLERGEPDWPAYITWLHYAEGSAMLPLMLQLYTSRLGEAAAPLHPRIESEIANHLGYISGELGGKAFLLGEHLSGADIQISFALEVARAFGKLQAYQNLSDYLDRLHARPAWKAALEKGGAYGLGQ